MLNYIILGIIQGLTEFLPVSSSGHLVILGKLLGITHGQVAITVVMHLGTAFALVAFFFNDLFGLFKDLKLVLRLAVTTIITVAIALAGRDFFESLFGSPRMVAMALILTGLMLILTRKFPAGKKHEVSLKDAVILGLTQSVAIIPGISRSGTAISTLLFRGVDWKESFRFSFLAAIPVVFGAAILEAGKIDVILKEEALDLGVGFVVSFLTGLWALHMIRLVLRKAKLHYFGYYCIIVAVITLILVKA